MIYVGWVGNFQRDVSVNGGFQIIDLVKLKKVPYLAKNCF